MFCSVVIGQEPKVADPMKAERQDMDEEATDELARVEPHRFILHIGLGPVVGPFKSDTAFVATDKSTIGECNTMGITREVRQHGLRPREGSLGIDNPFYLSRRCQILIEGRRVG
jgi:hypothetical protein